MGTLTFKLFEGMENIKMPKRSIIVGDNTKIWWIQL